MTRSTPAHAPARASGRPPAGRGEGTGAARRLAGCFLLLGLLAVAILSRLVPPFQTPDELAHLLRAEQVSQGVLLASRFRFAPNLDEHAGGRLDRGAEQVYHVFEPLIFHPETRASRDMFERADAIGWGGPAVWQSFDNTAVYPPLFYLPDALALRLGRRLGLNVSHTLLLARLANGAAAVLAGSLAVLLAGAAAPWLFALLCLPMTLSLFASASQDALLLAASALAAALLARLSRLPAQAGAFGLDVARPAAFRPDADPAARRDGAAPVGDRLALAACTALLACVVSARPPYLPVALLPVVLLRGPGRLGAGAGQVGRRWLACAFVLACGLGWSALAASHALVNGSDNRLADAHAQLSLLLAHPLRVWSVAADTLRAHGGRLAESFVGRLGWLDLELPRPARRLAWLSLLLAAILAAWPGRRARGAAAATGPGSWHGPVVPAGDWPRVPAQSGRAASPPAQPLAPHPPAAQPLAAQPLAALAPAGASDAARFPAARSPSRPVAPAALADRAGQARTPGRGPGLAGRVLALLVLLAAGGLLFAIQYLTWTPVGAARVEGVQGRYFLPLALLAAPALAAARPEARRLSVGLVALAAAVLSMVAWSVVGRYYLR